MNRGAIATPPCAAERGPQQSGSELAGSLVPDELWELFRQVVPVKVVRRPQGGGRRRADDREALAGIVYAASTGRAWRQMPLGLDVRWQTAYRRFADWSKAGVWTRLHRLITDQLGERERLAIAAVCTRAAKDGTSARALRDR